MREGEEGQDLKTSLQDSGSWVTNMKPTVKLANEYWERHKDSINPNIKRKKYWEVHKEV